MSMDINNIAGEICSLHMVLNYAYEAYRTDYRAQSTQNLTRLSLELYMILKM